MGIVLRGPGIYVPETRLTNGDLVNFVDDGGEKVLDTSDEWIVGGTGIRERRIALEETVSDLGIKAVQNLQEKLGRELAVEEIVFASNNHNGIEFPSHAESVAEFLGIERVAIHDQLAGCTGTVYSIRGAYNSIGMGDVKSALVIGAERLSDMTNYGDRETCVLFGDGAGAYLLEEDSGEEGIIANYISGIPDKSRLLTQRRNGGKKLRKEGGRFIAYDAVDYYLTMNGRKVFRFATVAMKEAVHRVLDKSRYNLSDVDVIIPHGANIRIINPTVEELRKKGFRGEVFTNLEKYGNTSTASIPLATEEAQRREIICPGMLVLNVAFGAGLTYGANLYRASRDLS